MQGTVETSHSQSSGELEPISSIIDKPGDRELLAAHLACAGPLLWVSFSDKTKAPWLAAADQAVALYGGFPPIRLDLMGWDGRQ